MLVCRIDSKILGTRNRIRKTRKIINYSFRNAEWSDSELSAGQLFKSEEIDRDTAGRLCLILFCMFINFRMTFNCLIDKKEILNILSPKVYEIHKIC
jgi:hypothetical protein